MAGRLSTTTESFLNHRVAEFSLREKFLQTNGILFDLFYYINGALVLLFLI